MHQGSNLALIKFATLFFVFFFFLTNFSQATSNTFANNSWEQALIEENPYGLFSGNSPLLHVLTPMENAQKSPNNLSKELIEALKQRQLEMVASNAMQIPEKRLVVRETFTRGDELHNWLFLRKFFPEKELINNENEALIVEAMKNRALELAKSSSSKAEKKPQFVNAVAVYEVLAGAEEENENLNLARQLRNLKTQSWIPKDISIQEFKKQLANGEHSRLVDLKEAKDISNSKLYEEKQKNDIKLSSIDQNSNDQNEVPKHENPMKQLSGGGKKIPLKSAPSKNSKSSDCTDIIILFVLVLVLIASTVGIFEFLKRYKSKKNEKNAENEEQEA